MKKLVLVLVLLVVSISFGLTKGGIPHTFVAGKPALADSVNANFDTLDAMVDMVIDTLNKNFVRYNPTTSRDSNVKYLEIDTIGAGPIMQKTDSFQVQFRRVGGSYNAEVGVNADGDFNVVGNYRGFALFRPEGNPSTSTLLMSYRGNAGSGGMWMYNVATRRAHVYYDEASGALNIGRGALFEADMLITADSVSFRNRPLRVKNVLVADSNIVVMDTLKTGKLQFTLGNAIVDSLAENASQDSVVMKVNGRYYAVPSR